MGKCFFITATDTEVGKTYVSSGLLLTANNRKLSTIGLKPVASGCQLSNGQLYNEDALLLQKSASIQLDYSLVNPLTFAPAIAPHIAAQSTQTALNVKRLQQHTYNTLCIPADITIIEGSGGWHAPLNQEETMADYAVSLNCEIILVVGIRLGCINHAILTAQAIKNSGAVCAGWVANKIDPNMSYSDENIETLKNWLTTPLLATIEFNQSPQSALENITIF
jgi:dethiobiotin synthetase